MPRTLRHRYMLLLRLLYGNYYRLHARAKCNAMR